MEVIGEFLKGLGITNIQTAIAYSLVLFFVALILSQQAQIGRIKTDQKKIETDQKEIEARSKAETSYSNIINQLLGKFDKLADSFDRLVKQEDERIVARSTDLDETRKIQRQNVEHIHDLTSMLKGGLSVIATSKEIVMTTEEKVDKILAAMTEFGRKIDQLDADIKQLRVDFTPKTPVYVQPPFGGVGLTIVPGTAPIVPTTPPTPPTDSPGYILRDGDVK